jgi:hypothetical protein
MRQSTFERSMHQESSESGYTLTALQWSRQSRCTYLEVPLHLQGAMKSLPAHGHREKQSTPAKTGHRRITRAWQRAAATARGVTDPGARTVGLEADPALELVPGAGLEVDLRGRRRDERRRRRGQPPRLLVLHRPPRRAAPSRASLRF